MVEIISNTIHWFLCLLIRLYKAIEYGILKIFEPYVVKQFLRLNRPLNIIFEGDRVPKIELDKESEFPLNSEYRSVVRFQIHDRSFFTSVVNLPTLAFGETYLDKIWDCDDLEEFVYRMIRSKMYMKLHHNWNKFLSHVEFGMFNRQSKARSYKVGREHYDLGNDLYESFLDPYMQYTCAYWARADNLNDAQLHKMELIAQKLKLKPGMKVLDIGCGWGMLCKYLAENHGVQCVGVSIGAEGIKYGQEQCKGLSVELRLQDYRDVDETFDRIVSVGCLEHVGQHNYRTYFKVANKCLKDDGIFLVHAIGVNHEGFPRVDSFADKYIFPNSMLPYHRDITKYTEGLFIIEDWHHLSYDYCLTLRAWKANFLKSWPTLSEKYCERFFRMWMFYFEFASALFRARTTQLWQGVLTKNGLLEGYRSVR